GRRRRGRAGGRSGCGRRWSGPGTRYLSVIRALLRREGLRVPSGGAAAFARRLAAVPLSPTQQALIAPLVTLLTPLNAAIAAADARVARRGRAPPVAPPAPPPPP